MTFTNRLLTPDRGSIPSNSAGIRRRVIPPESAGITGILVSPILFICWNTTYWFLGVFCLESYWLSAVFLTDLF